MSDKSNDPSLKDADIIYLKENFDVQQSSSSLKSRLKKWLLAKELTLYCVGHSSTYIDIQRLTAFPYEAKFAKLGRFDDVPELADVLLIIGPISEKNSKRINEVYLRMRKPTWVIYFGIDSFESPLKSSITYDSKIRETIPADIIIPGKYPRPEALFEALEKIHKMIKLNLSPKGTIDD